jgi:hypothetical protein
MVTHLDKGVVSVGHGWRAFEMRVVDCWPMRGMSQLCGRYCEEEKGPREKRKSNEWRPWMDVRMGERDTQKTGEWAERAEFEL